MPRTKQVQENKPDELVQAEQHVKDLRKSLRRNALLEDARKTLLKYESEYEHAKEVFFKVNGARRVLKTE